MLNSWFKVDIGSKNDVRGMFKVDIGSKMTPSLAPPPGSTPGPTEWQRGRAGKELPCDNDNGKFGIDALRAKTAEELQAMPAFQRVIAAQTHFEKTMYKVNETVANGIEEGAQSRIIIPS